MATKIEKAEYRGYTRLPGTNKFAVAFFVDEEPEVGDGLFDIIPHKEKRSLNANAFMWLLCTRIAEVTRLDKLDIYREEIRHQNAFDDIEFKCKEAAEKMAKGWEHNGDGWIAEQLDFAAEGDGVVWRFYRGSSTYNASEMARLIDCLVEDCEALGIDCSTEEYRNKVLDEWAILKQEERMNKDA